MYVYIYEYKINIYIYIHINNSKDIYYFCLIIFQNTFWFFSQTNRKFKIVQLYET